MSNKQQRVRSTAVPVGADDLQTIDGIGPGIESRLYSANIHTYAQLADLSPNEIVPLVAGIAGMSIDRIIKQDWIGQARKLVPGGLASQQFAMIDQEPLELREEILSPALHHPYATFTVELLLDDDNNVRRTRAKHVQRGTEDSWAGWHAARLTDFFVHQGALRVLSEENTVAETAELAAETVGAAEAVMTELATETVAATDALAAALPAPVAGSTATLRLYDLGISSAGAAISRHMLRAGQPFVVDLTLNIDGVTLPADLLISYMATLSAKKMGDRQRLVLSEANGTVLMKDSPAITITCNPLVRGIYRLEAAVTLKLPDTVDTASGDISALLEGNLIQVY